MDLRQIYMEDVFGPSLGEFEGKGQGSRSPGTETAFIRPFGGLRVW